ncbi:MAG: hypothetical protein O3A51_06595, partial [Verrucomicrobia bacterium]|nr:hypothetical protein [Verrucomicrobiota bacterium]
PNYRSMDITRVLPDSLRISMTPREPIARIGRTGGFVVDRDRTVFGYRGDKSGLPTMLGYRGPMLTPGDRVTGQTADAILVIDVARSMDLGSELVIEGVDVRGRFRGRPDDMRIYLEGEIIVDLWWKRGQGESGEADLRARLEYLRGILRKTDQQRNRVKKVNLTLDSYETNTPVEYWH